MPNETNFKLLDAKICNVEKNQDKLDKRVTDLEKSVGEVNNVLDKTIAKLETKFDMYSQYTNERLTGFATEIKEMTKNNEEKMETIIELFSGELKNPKVDNFKEWAMSFGLKIIEYGIIGGLVVVLYSKLK